METGLVAQHGQCRGAGLFQLGAGADAAVMDQGRHREDTDALGRPDMANGRFDKAIGQPGQSNAPEPVNVGAIFRL